MVTTTPTHGLAAATVSGGYLLSPLAAQLLQTLAELLSVHIQFPGEPLQDPELHLQELGFGVPQLASLDDVPRVDVIVLPVP